MPEREDPEDHRLDIQRIKDNLRLRAIGKSDQMTAAALDDFSSTQEEIVGRVSDPTMRAAIMRMTAWGEQQIIAISETSVREIRAQLTPRDLFPTSRQQDTGTKLSPFRRAMSAAWRTVTGILPHRQR